MTINELPFITLSFSKFDIMKRTTSIPYIPES